MTCREATEFLMDYLADELPDIARHTFEQHLSVCPNCRAYLALYRATIQLGRQAFRNNDAAADERIPEELVEAILAAKSVTSPS